MSLNAYFSYSVIDWMMLIIAIFTLLMQPIAAFYCRRQAEQKNTSLCPSLIKQTWLQALFLLIILVAIPVLQYLIDCGILILNPTWQTALFNILDLLRCLVSLWLFVRYANILYTWLQLVASDGQHETLMALLPQIKNSLKFSFIALMSTLFVPHFIRIALSPAILNKVLIILAIWAIAWMFMQVIAGFENYMLRRYSQQLTESFKARRVYTQARVFRRIAMSVVGLLAVAATLTVFDAVREFGTSILASAGIAGVVLGVAAQKSLANIFAGLQIALTQPIRINDSVVVENEFGVIEEISLSHVVVRIWDLRRLILPINYFLEKPFQNQTRASTNLLSPTFIYADYTLPIEPLREEFHRILKQTPLWDGKVAALQVSGVTEYTIQIRALASAKNTGDDYDIRCVIREKLIEFINKNYPQCLPRVRNINQVTNN
jgi:small-conductance mechanosensitive channel